MIRRRGENFHSLIRSHAVPITLLQCINCAACSNFAPETFHRGTIDAAHVVYHQPESVSDIDKARAALAACPVAAIRVETLAEKRHRATDKEAVTESWSDGDQALVQKMSIAENKPFPRPFLEDHNAVPGVYWTGHHNEASFGATPYLTRAVVDGKPVWIMVDTPKYSRSAINAVELLTGSSGPDYLFLTHVDDTADHGKYAEHYPSMQRIFHEGDLGRHNWIGDTTLADVETLLSNVDVDSKASSGLVAYQMDGTPVPLEQWLAASDDADTNVIILHTPGHSPGSLSLYKRPDASNPTGVLFTGDTYGWTTRDGGRMTAFSKYGNNLGQQSETLKSLVKLPWQVIAPGHGHPRDYRGQDDSVRREEMENALEEITSS